MPSTNANGALEKKQKAKAVSFIKHMPASIEADKTFAAVFDFCLPILFNGQYAVMAHVAAGGFLTCWAPLSCTIP